MRSAKNHTVYSLRRCFKDRLIAVEAPDSLTGSSKPPGLALRVVVAVVVGELAFEGTVGLEFAETVAPDLVSRDRSRWCNQASP